MTPSLPTSTSLGPIRLTVADLPASAAFYETVLGLRPLRADGDELRLGTAAGTPLVELVERADAAPRPARSSGLFHLALLLPSRAELALALRRLALARHPLEGASDHLVSEALYLSDPEGNGIEIYRDRPRAEWGREPDGQIRMATLPLDLDAVLAELPEDLDPGSPDPGVPAGAVIGHVHLQVSDLDQAEAFYNGVLGFDVVVRGYPGALFVSAGGYHHHLGLNTWASAGGAPNAPGTRGLDRFTIVLPTAADVAAAGKRLAAAGAPATAAADGSLAATDPFGNELLLTATAS
ncbi:VOC family protein [Conexibacter woesei]|uniref:Glyoxalase/bleomycin resistance protein/dioxygenase n=1 Tax=Conexibacter woesei (strain DSM 14684 / CCUG 47730 / CIP 108061 / JCM 11494 / NBRC 100937 / ID131577) TaxID=469383 RepID=D3FB70_CONWI|nr:VOC family protein [Conexibacter woesei]ADB53262.1 Glyoxalase/bleomycin resistance protein/dioxygenase [Conexibacter woesei DSM 14684]